MLRLTWRLPEVKKKLEMRFPEKRLNLKLKKHYTTFLDLTGFQDKVVEIREKT